MTKEKLIGWLAIAFGVVSFYDCLHMIKIHGVPIRLFFLPVFLVAFGWIELHGRHKPLEKKILHHSHVGVYLAVIVIIVVLWRATR